MLQLRKAIRAHSLPYKAAYRYSTSMSETKRTSRPKVGIIGAGRIGRVHAESLFRSGAEIVAVVDPIESAAQQVYEEFNVGSWSTEPNDIFDNDDIQAVVICSPTNLHATHMETAASKGKHIFCEKPIALDLNTVAALTPKIQQSGVHCMLGFNRRFDSNAMRVKRAIMDNEIGDVSMVRITSYDPSPPPTEYIKVSGGLFVDMAIHDFDMARFLVNSEVKEVYALGKCRDPKIAEAGDIDTAMILLTFENGVIASIENSRTAAYGYDQRIEVLGSRGGVSSSNRHANEVVISDSKNVRKDLPMHFFLDRYEGAYSNEMREFVKMLKGGSVTTSLPGVKDGLEALRIALAAARSHSEGRPIELSQIYC